MSSHAAYHLPAPDVMAQALTRELPAFAACQWEQESTSTNVGLLAIAREAGMRAGWPRLLGAHHQTHGKGRLGRTWRNVPGQALMFSCGFAQPAANQALSGLQGLGPAIGICSTLALRPFFAQPDRLRMKWPNDLMLDDSKCAGILIEVTTKANNTFVVIGMGINLTGHSELEAELHRTVADIGPSLQPDTTATGLVRALATAWQQCLSTMSTDGFEAYRAAYASIDFLADQHVDIVDQGQIIAQGVTDGLQRDGALTLRTPQGIKTFLAGEVSVRLKTPTSPI